MTATVRAFCHSGVTTAAVTGTMFATDSVSLVKQPYLARSSVTVDTGTAQSTTAAPAGTTLLLVQVEAGKAVHLEVNPPNRSTAADTGSPIYSGTFHLACGVDWTISVLESTIV